MGLINCSVSLVYEQLLDNGQVVQTLLGYLCNATGKDMFALKTEAEQYHAKNNAEKVAGKKVTLWHITTLTEPKTHHDKHLEFPMNDMKENFDYIKELNKQRKERNLANASREGWHLHTEYHWSRTLEGKRLDYWPSKNKFQYESKVMCGDVFAFIKQREAL